MQVQNRVISAIAFAKQIANLSTCAITKLSNWSILLKHGAQSHFVYCTVNAIASSIIICYIDILSLNRVTKKRIIYFTGGDGQFFERFFQKSIYDKNMLFRSMLEVIKQKDIK